MVGQESVNGRLEEIGLRLDVPPCMRCLLVTMVLTRRLVMMLRFLTGGFDRYMRLWDTETGQCINTVTNRKVGTYNISRHPPISQPLFSH